MEGQGLISYEDRENALHQLDDGEAAIEKAMEEKRQKQLAKFRNRLHNKRGKVRISVVLLHSHITLNIIHQCT